MDNSDLEEKAFSAPPIMDVIVSHLNGPREVLSLANCSRNLTDSVLRSVGEENFVVKFTSKLNNQAYCWYPILYVNDGAKIYVEKIPTNVLNACRCVVGSHYFQTLPNDFEPQLFFPHNQMLADQLEMLAQCESIRKLQLASVTFNEADLADRKNNVTWEHLKHAHIEDVHSMVYVPGFQPNIATGKPRSTDRIATVNLHWIRQMCVPPTLISLIWFKKKIESIKLISLYLDEKSLEIMESASDKDHKKLNTIHLEDLVVEEDLLERMDNVSMRIIQSPIFQNLTLSLQRGAYGMTLLDKIIGIGTNVDRLHLIINTQLSNERLFSKITKLNCLCKEISLTFYRTWQQRPLNFIDPSMVKEMKKWSKVTEVTLGKRLFPYLENHVANQRFENTTSYLDYLNNIIFLPNLKKFGLKDRVGTEVLERATQYISHSSFEEITLAVSDSLTGWQNSMPAYNSLLQSIPTTTSHLNLLFFPLQNDSSSDCLRKMARSLKKLTYFQLEDQKITKREIKQLLPHTEINMKKNVCSSNGGLRQSIISNWLVNERVH